jgi:Flp pilus assembly protein TadG
MTNWQLGRRLQQDEHGASTIEFVLALPFLLVLIAGIIEFGLFIWEKQALTAAANVGARLAASDSTATTTAIETATKNALKNSGFSQSQIDQATVTKQSDYTIGNITMKVVRVTKPYAFTLLPNFFSAFNYILKGDPVSSSLTVKGEAKVVQEYE